MAAYVHAQNYDELSEIEFPSENFSEEEETVTRRCTSFGEAVIMIANDPKTLGITDFFKSFYNGFPEISISGLHIRMKKSFMRIPSNSSLILGRLTKKPQRL